MPEKVKAPEKKIICLGTGIYAEAEKHSNKEMPKCYPERIIHLSPDELGLMNCHSPYFVPTAENQEKLAVKIKGCKAWYYVHLLPKGRERV